MSDIGEIIFPIFFFFSGMQNIHFYHGETFSRSRQRRVDQIVGYSDNQGIKKLQQVYYRLPEDYNQSLPDTSYCTENVVSCKFGFFPVSLTSEILDTQPITWGIPKNAVFCSNAYIMLGLMESNWRQTEKRIVVFIGGG